MFIVRLCYNILLMILIPFVLPIGYLIAMKQKEEKDFFQRIGAVKIPKQFNKSIWIHCASVGEVRSIKHLVKKIKEELPDLEIVISTTTATGKDMAEKELKPDLAMLLPLENSFAISMLIDMLQCKAVFIVDTELWPNFIYTASKKVKLFLINARLSDKSFKYYKLFKFIFKNILKRFDYIYTKSEDDFNKFSKIKGSSDNVSCIGNLKFYFEENKKDYDIEPEFQNLKIAFASSTHNPEEKMFLEAIKKSNENFDKILLAPRHLNRVEDIENILRLENISYDLYSTGENKNKYIIIDEFGLLEKFYSVSDKIFIGGSTEGTGGHNIFEALQFEKVIATGSDMSNFKEIFEIAKKHNVISVADDLNSLSDYLKEKNFSPDFNSFFAEIKHFNESTDTILKCIKEILND